MHNLTRTSSSTNTGLKYIHRDHLGSVDVISKSDGTLKFNLSYDPFGSRRKSDWSMDITASSLSTITNAQASRGSRGFTGHEHLDRTGLIHMNGRIFDPRLGRFLQPDPIVQSPSFSQSYNRYAYVFNDPLSLTDPSGFCTSSNVNGKKPGLGSRPCGAGGLTELETVIGFP